MRSRPCPQPPAPPPLSLTAPPPTPSLPPPPPSRAKRARPPRCLHPNAEQGQGQQGGKQVSGEKQTGCHQRFSACSEQPKGHPVTFIFFTGRICFLGSPHAPRTGQKRENATPRPRFEFGLPTFLPLIYFANQQLSQKNGDPGHLAGKVVRSARTATTPAGWIFPGPDPRQAARCAPASQHRSL